MTTPAIVMNKPKRPVGYDKVRQIVSNWPEYRHHYTSIKQIRFESRVVPIQAHKTSSVDPFWGFIVSLGKSSSGWVARAQVGQLSYWGTHIEKVAPEAADQVQFALSEFMVKLQTLTGPLDESF